MLTKLDDTNFDTTVVRSDTPCLVMFTAPWAGPCNLARPVLEQIAQRYGNQMVFGEFNIDDNPDTPERFGVRTLPVFYMFDDGVPVEVVAGALPMDRLFAMISEFV